MNNFNPYFKNGISILVLSALTSGCAIDRAISPDLMDFRDEIDVEMGIFEVDKSLPEVVDTKTGKFPGLTYGDRTKTSVVFIERIDSLIWRSGLYAPGDSGCRINIKLKNYKKFTHLFDPTSKLPYKYPYSLNYVFNVQAKNGEKFEYEYQGKFVYSTLFTFDEIFPVLVQFERDMRKNVFPNPRNIDTPPVQKFVTFMKTNCPPVKNSPTG